MLLVSVTPPRIVRGSLARIALLCGALLPTSIALADPFATSVVNFNQGSGGSATYADPNAALGEPARVTGAAFGFPGVVSMFNPPFDPNQLVSIGRGGSLTVHFDQPITNDPSHLYGADLIVFGNAGFIDTAYPTGQIGNPASLFGADNAQVEVSADGVNFVALAPLVDSLFPTQGYLDSGPYDAAAGNVPSNFLMPMNPALSLASFNGLNFAQALALYDGSGGGTPIDIAASGLSSVSFVRISVAANGSPAEIDALAAVPEPMVGMPLLVAALVIARRKRRSI